MRLDQIAGRLIEDAVSAGRLPAAPSPESLVRIADAIRSVTASPAKNKTAPVLQLTEAIKEDPRGTSTQPSAGL